MDPAFQHCIKFYSGFSFCIGITKQLKYIIESINKIPEPLEQAYQYQEYDYEDYEKLARLQFPLLYKNVVLLFACDASKENRGTCQHFFRLHVQHINA